MAPERESFYEICFNSQYSLQYFCLLAFRYRKFRQIFALSSFWFSKTSMMTPLYFAPYFSLFAYPSMLWAIAYGPFNVVRLIENARELCAFLKILLGNKILKKSVRFLFKSILYRFTEIFTNSGTTRFNTSWTVFTIEWKRLT